MASLPRRDAESESDARARTGARPGEGPVPPSAPSIQGYELHGVVGRGSSGVVYRATQLAMDRTVAIKVLHLELLGTRAVRRLQREARTTARLTHPGIVSAIDMGQVAGVWWYAMEWVEGRSLAQILEARGRLGEREAIRMLIPVCEALQHAFEHGVVHRDIKPGNILVDGNQRALLVDLGLAFTEQDPTLTRQSGMLGTPYYISPEQARDPTVADIRSDIYSYGASLFHCLCGRPPYTGNTVAEILSGVLYSRIPDPRSLEENLSKGVALVLRKCLARDPDRRYQEPDQLLADLERLRERRGVQVQARSLDPLLGQRSSLIRISLAAAAVLVPVGAWFGYRALGADGRAPIEVPSAAAVHYEPLESLATRLAAGEAPATLLAELDELQAEVPPAASERFAEVSRLVNRGYRRALTEFRREQQRQFDELVFAGRDYAAARDFLDRGLESALVATLALSHRQRLEFLQSDWVIERRAQYEEQLNLGLQHLRETLSGYYRDVVSPRVDSRQRKNEWVSARSELSADVEKWIADAGVAARLPYDRLQEILGGLRERVNQRELHLNDDWRALDESLVAFVSERAAHWSAELDAREPGTRVDDRLRAEFAARLDEIGLAPAESLLDVSRGAWDAVEARAAQLAGLEARLLESDAELWFDHVLRQVAPQIERRRYADLVRAWEGGLQRGWPADVHERIAGRLEEARLLQAFLGRAVAGLRARNGEEEIFYLGAISVRGVVEAGGNILEEGFGLRVPTAGVGAPVRHRLWICAHGEDQAERIVTAGDIERLAGLPADPASIRDPQDRYVRALFRFYEGEVDEAAATLASGVRPSGNYESRWNDLEHRMGDAQSESRAGIEERQARAEELYRLVKRERSHEADLQDALQLVERLLEEFGDLAWVREREGELRSLRKRWGAAEDASPRELLERNFGPLELEVKDNGRVSLVFSFFTEDAGAWSRGDWRTDGTGWIAPTAFGREDLFLPTRWPRLVLREPLSIESGALAVELRIEQPRESGPPRLMVISVAGIHVALAGPGERGTGRWAVVSNRAELRGLVDRVLLGEGEPFVGLKRGKTHSIRVELTRGRGKVAVEVDGRALGSVSIRSPEAGEPGSYGLVVRSLEPVRLLEVRLFGSHR